ncbi:MAG: phage Gp37/Gp68 family protein [Devosia nanyangense]|uniref:Phage Gp37/Gp68 family protein n=1 Tax=Devosia nanyangense TaxID=1228055 RepID=A0A933NYV8_9HYPH|nr:phage Gp37/Gp68 family protein [Devosia nanyangense]
MSDKSLIEWTDATWNPLRGCSRVSEGCRHCYAEGVAARFSGPGQPYEGLAGFVVVKTVARGKTTDPIPKPEPRWTGKVVRAPHDTLTQPLRWKRPRRIFVNSMSDLFHESVPDEWIDQVFAVMALSPQHVFQVLTKRPERMRDYLASGLVAPNATATQARVLQAIDDLVPERTEASIAAKNRVLSVAVSGLQTWPLPNVWLGVSAEDQKRADERIPLLLATPAAVRFVSLEPLLGPIDVIPYLFIYTNADDEVLLDHTDRIGPEEPLPFHDPATTDPAEIATPRLDWVIVGGESGPGARPMHPDWARSLRDQCVDAGVPFFFKQRGEWAPGIFEDMGDYLSFEPAEPGVRAKPITPDNIRWFDGATAPDGPGAQLLGKKAAGRLLDGVEHNGLPAVGTGAPKRLAARPASGPDGQSVGQDK